MKNSKVCKCQAHHRCKTFLHRTHHAPRPLRAPHHTRFIRVDRARLRLLRVLRQHPPDALLPRRPRRRAALPRLFHRHVGQVDASRGARVRDAVHLYAELRERVAVDHEHGHGPKDDADRRALVRTGS